MATPENIKKNTGLLDDYPWLYRLYPSFMKTQQRNKELVISNVENIKHIPKAKREEAILELLQDPDIGNELYKKLPESDYTKAIILEAARNEIPELINSNSARIFSSELVKDILAIDLNYFDSFYKYNLPQDVIEFAVKEHGAVILSMDKNDITIDLLEIILDDDHIYKEEGLDILTYYSDPDQVLKAYQKFEHCKDPEGYANHSYIHKESYTQDLVDYIIDKDIHSTLFFPEEFLDQKKCFNAIQQYPDLLSYVPAKYRDLDTCMTSFHHNPANVKDFPLEFLTGERVKELIKETPLAIIPLNNRIDLSKEMWQLAVDGNHPNQWFISKHIPYVEMAMQNYRKHGGEFNEDFADRKEYARVVIKKEPEQYRNLPQSIKNDPELAELAVKRDYQNILHIKKDFVSLELCMLVCKKDPGFFFSIAAPDACLQTATALIDQSPENYFKIPKEKRDPRITAHYLTKTFDKDPSNFHIFKTINASPYSCMKALDQLEKEHVIPFIKCIDKENLESTRFVEKAVTKNPEVLTTLKDEYKTPTACVIAILQNERYKRFVPDSIAKGNNIFTYYMANKTQFRGIKNMDSIEESFRKKWLKREKNYRNTKPLSQP